MSADSLSTSETSHIVSLATSGLASESSRRAYTHAIISFLAWHQSQPSLPISRLLVQTYRQHLIDSGLSPATVNVHLCALRRMVSEAAENSLLDSDIQGSISRISGVSSHGVRIGRWLSVDQARALLDSPDDSPQGLRDRAALALLIGCGLRRSEVSALRFEDIQQRDGRWVIADMTGKGRRVRTVPIPAWVKVRLDDWAKDAVLSSGRVLRSVNKAGDAWGDGLDANGVWNIVRRHAERCGLGKLAPHDLRRTCAKLCRKAGGHIEQIQMLLGHSSVRTTERYLGTVQELTVAVNDNIGLESSL